MSQRSLTERVLDVLDLAMRPLTAAEIRRWLPDDVTAEELSSCLVKMLKRGAIEFEMVDRKAITGPRQVKAYKIKAEQESRAA